MVNDQLKNWSSQSNYKWYNEVTYCEIFPICHNFGLLKCGKSAFSKAKSKSLFHLHQEPKQVVLNYRAEQ